jgi:dihydrofolate reductase/thymidylate synthase
MSNPELIVAVDRNYGIGYKNELPWGKNKEELKLFREKTLGSTLIFGRKTFENLPKLDSREIICITKKKYFVDEIWRRDLIKATVVSNLENAQIFIKNKKAFIAGGREIYKLALEKPNYINRIHMSIIKGTYECDTFFDVDLIKDFVIVEHIPYVTFDHYVLERNSVCKGERQYLDLIDHILSKGNLAEGRNGFTYSIFVNHMSFDLREGFPLLTTKKMFSRGIIEELLFFLRGDTDSKILEEKGINIWKDNTSKEFIESRGLHYAEGVMGPMYGRQFRNFNGSYVLNQQRKPVKSKEGVDQLANVVDLIKNDPKSRRILMTAYNPSQSEQGVLYPCHSIALQFYVDGEYLDMYCFNRSSDVFLGLPFNIASSSLLLMIIAKITSKVPRHFHLSLGDSHIYETHVEQVREQKKRIPYKFCTIIIPEISSIKDIEKLSAKDFILVNYKSQDSIKAEMVA